MRELILRELRYSAGVWVCGTIVAAGVAMAASVPATLLASANGASGEQALGLYSLASTVLALTLVSAVVALAGAVRQIVVARTSQIAQWSLLGATPAQIRLITSAQVFVVAVVGALLGAAAGWVLAPPFVAYGLLGTVGLGEVVPAAPVTVPIGVAGAVSLLALACAAGAGRAAADLARKGRRRVPTAATLLALVAIAMLSGVPSASSGGASQLLLIGPVTVAALAASGAPVLRWAARAWTAGMRSARPRLPSRGRGRCGPRHTTRPSSAGWSSRSVCPRGSSRV